MRFLSLFVICFVVWVGLASAQEMLRLERLLTWDSEITDLTGLEHATFLKDLRIPTPHSMTLRSGENT